MCFYFHQSILIVFWPLQYTIVVSLLNIFSFSCKPLIINYGTTVLWPWPLSDHQPELTRNTFFSFCLSSPVTRPFLLSLDKSFLFKVTRWLPSGTNYANSLNTPDLNYQWFVPWYCPCSAVTTDPPIPPHSPPGPKLGPIAAARPGQWGHSAVINCEQNQIKLCTETSGQTQKRSDNRIKLRSVQLNNPRTEEWLQLIYFIESPSSKWGSVS